MRGLAIPHEALDLICHTIAAAAEKAFNLLNPIFCYYVASLDSMNSFYFEIYFAWHFLLFFGDRAPLCGSDWPGTHCVEQAGLEFTGICLLESKDYSYAPCLVLTLFFYLNIFLHCIVQVSWFLFYWQDKTP